MTIKRVHLSLSQKKLRRIDLEALRSWGVTSTAAEKDGAGTPAKIFATSRLVLQKETRVYKSSSCDIYNNSVVDQFQFLAGDIPSFSDSRSSRFMFQLCSSLCTGLSKDQAPRRNVCFSGDRRSVSLHNNSWAPPRRAENGCLKRIRCGINIY